MPTYQSPLPGDTVFVLKKKKKRQHFIFLYNSFENYA